MPCALRKYVLPEFLTVGGDALSIKDIIRTLRNDPERTEQLKAIVIRTDIDDAKKLEMASALVE